MADHSTAQHSIAQHAHRTVQNTAYSTVPMQQVQPNMSK